jgi:protein disulfide-isomerase A1
MAKTILELTSKNDVLEPNSEIFPKVIEANNMVLVSFFWRISPSAIRFVPIFERVCKFKPDIYSLDLSNHILQTMQAARDFGVLFAQVDVVESPDLRTKFDITTYPAVMLFQAIDNFKRYNG